MILGKQRWRRGAAVLLTGGLMAAAFTGASAQGFPGMFGHGGYGGPGWQENADPAALQKRAEGMVRMMLADVNATPEQEQRIAKIISDTMTAMRPVRQSHMAARRKMMDLLAQPTIDRQAVEALRAQELASAEQASRRMTQSMIEVAEVLSPEQRAKLAERMRSRGGRGPGPGPGGAPGQGPGPR